MLVYVERSTAGCVETTSVDISVYVTYNPINCIYHLFAFSRWELVAVVCIIPCNFFKVCVSVLVVVVYKLNESWLPMSCVWRTIRIDGPVLCFLGGLVIGFIFRGRWSALAVDSSKWYWHRNQGHTHQFDNRAIVDWIIAS